jgi:predicted N-acetyltransferase YhbS
MAIPPLHYRREEDLAAAEFRQVLIDSTLGARRPVDDLPRLERMLRHANLVVTARDEAGRLVGVSRSVTDFAFACYLSDLAVAVDQQHGGVGRRLIEVTLEHLEPGAKLVLLAAPAAVDYYAKVGFTQHPSAWTRDR